jgi:DNA-binding Lrp family transcriptional regulator
VKHNNKLRKKILREAYINGLDFENNKNINIKKTTADYILEKLHEEKYYTKKRYVVDLNHFKIGNFAWVFVCVNWNEIDEKTFVEKLTSLPYVHTIADITGNFDIAIKIIGNQFRSINSYIFEIEKMFSGAIVNTKIYYLNKEIKNSHLITKKREDVELNKVDESIIIEKDKNPKIKLSEIAKKYGYHRNTISKRWSTLINKKIILKETLDLTHKGYKFINMGLKAFIILHTYPGKRDKIINNLKNEERVQDIFTTISNGVIAIVRVEDSEDLSTIHKKLSKFKDIKGTETIIFLTKHTRKEMTREELKYLKNH